METTITALEMRKKFGGVLDRVVRRGDHITIIRGQRHLATLIPAKEHEKECLHRDRARKIEELVAEIDDWQKKNPKKMRKLAKSDSTKLIRRMRETRWSSLTPRS